MMTFSGDPHLGMSTDKFAGSAVVFISTVTFRTRHGFVALILFPIWGIAGGMAPQVGETRLAAHALGHLRRHREPAGNELDNQFSMPSACR